MKFILESILISVFVIGAVGLSVTVHADSLGSAQTERADSFDRFYHAIQSGKAPSAAFESEVAPAEQNFEKALSEATPSTESGISGKEGSLMGAPSGMVQVSSQAPTVVNEAQAPIDGSQFPRELEFPGPAPASVKKAAK